MSLFLVAVIIFLGIVTQSAAGFGMALVSMPLLAPFFDIKLISPLVALAGILAKVLLLVKYHSKLEIKAVTGLVISSALLVPAGTFALAYMDQRISLLVLGVVVLIYALYSLINFIPPRLHNPNWVYLFGGLAGFLGGALNASGPPVVIYATSRRWDPLEFKANLQGYALVNGIVVVASHYLAGNITPQVMQAFVASIPAVFVGVWVGVSMDKFLQPARFRKLVLWLLVVVSLRMIF